MGQLTIRSGWVDLHNNQYGFALNGRVIYGTGICADRVTYSSQWKQHLDAKRL